MSTQKHRRSISISSSFDGDLAAFSADVHSDKNMIVFASYLSKKGKFNKAMQLRYCIVYTDRKLAYFKKSGDKTPSGYIYLSTVSAINMYLPQKMSQKKGKKDSVSETKSNDDDDDGNFLDLHKIKRKRADSVSIKTTSLSGANNEYGFELVTPKRVWVFSCNDSNIFSKWMDILRNLCFGKRLHSGYLRKMGQKYKTWRCRYFAIYDLNEIRYFEDDTYAVQKGKIELKTVTKIVKAKANQYHYTHCIELHTNERVWVLAPKTQKKRDIWLNAIENVQKSHRNTFVPISSGFISMYLPHTQRWRKYYFAAYKTKSENRLCCFENQIECKQLEKMVSFGDEQYELNCKAKMKRIIPLCALVDVVAISRFEFKTVNEECKDELNDKKYLFTLKLRDEQYYLCPHPNKERVAQSWVNLIKNLRCSKRQNVYSKLRKLGYKSSYISAALEQYENAYGTGKYIYNDIKGMIDRMAKPSTGSVSTNTSRTSSNSVSSSPMFSGVDLPLTSLNEAKSLSILDIDASYSKILDEENVLSWSTNDVLMWIKSLENGFFSTKYPNFIENLKRLNVEGDKLRQLSDNNLQTFGVCDELHRALIMEHMSNLFTDIAIEK